MVGEEGSNGQSSSYQPKQVLRTVIHLFSLEAIKLAVITDSNALISIIFFKNARCCYTLWVELHIKSTFQLDKYVLDLRTCSAPIREALAPKVTATEHNLQLMK